MRLLAPILLLILAVNARAATIVAASCSRAAVSNAVFAASSGDTVVIPPGTCDWAEWFGITNKAIRLTGSGVGVTIIRSDLATTPWITVWLQAGEITEIDNIEFQRDAGADSGDIISISGINTDNRNLNLHHCTFNGWTNATIFGLQTVRGVIHHNQFTDIGLLYHAKDSYYDGTFGVNDYGNQSMFAPDLFGTTNFVFIEGNIYSNRLTGATDGQAGARYVYRYNTNWNVNVQTHGSEAAERGGRAFEIYSNYFHRADSTAQAAFMRGGVTLLYGNVWTNWTIGTTFNLVDNRILEHLFAPYNGATGSNPWDTNASGIYTNGTVSDTGGPLSNVITDFSRDYTVNAYQHMQLVRTSGKAVTTLSRSGSTATASVTGHGFTSGDSIAFWGADQYGWNGYFPITVTDANTFTFDANYPFTSPATGTIKCSKGNNFARILSNTATNITTANSIYGEAHSLRLTNPDTYEIRKVIGAMDQVGVYGGSNFLTAAMPDLYNTFAGAQTVSMCYQWSNSTAGGAAIAWTTGFAGGGDYNHIIPGKHYTNSIAKPGYTPYTYPHPLATGSASNGVAGASHGVRATVSGKVEISGRALIQ